MRSTSSFLTYYQALTNVIVNAGRGFYKAILKQYDTNVRCYKSFQKKYLARLPNIIAALLFYTFILSGCENNKPAILFHAGAGQRSSLDEIAVIFAERNPDIKIDFSYKGSGYFIADITASKMGDLYMPGEEYYLLQAVNRGFIDDYNPQTDITAHFITVIITPKGNPKQITKIEDFKRGGLRIGLADPEAAAIGLWHEKTFKKAGIWDAVKQNATMYAKCIPELGNAVQLGAIDATIVWATTAVLYLKDIEIVPIEPQYRGIIRLPIALLKFSQQPTFAKKIKAFILSDEGKKIFHSHAYGINAVPTDDTGFCTDNGQATTDDMKWLVAAAKVAKDPSIAVTKATVGHLVKEVLRQRQTLH